MTIKKNVGNPVEVEMAIEHKGAPIDVVAYWDMAPGYPTQGWQQADAVHIAHKIYYIPISPNNGADWHTVILADFRGVYPTLLYHTIAGTPYEKADCRIGIYAAPLDSTTPPILQALWEDVYELEVPVAEFRNLAGTFT